MDAFNQMQLERFQKATPPETLCPEVSLVRNFAMHHLDANVRAYGKSVNGCEQTGADVMLTFGSKIAVLDGNNQPMQIEKLRHVDVFLSRKQAEGLLKELQEVLNEHG